jgi:aminopeptidase-like protein
MMDLISLCDGQNSLLKIAETLKTPIWKLYELIDKLVEYELLEINE